MSRHPLLIASVVLALGPTAPSTAPAQAPGVTFDDGPSAKEYAIPLDAARGQTKTKAPTARVRTTPQPAATPPPPPAATTTPAAKPKSSQPEQQPTRTTKAAAAVVAAPKDPPAADGTHAAAPASPGSDGTDAGVVIGGLALAAIALGSLAGLLLRRRRQPVDEY
jgi:hypothetical protein